MRDIRFDIMRGVGILLMLLGHIPIEGFGYKLIYSFHMPMFFILAGYFTKTIQTNNGEGRSHIIRLIFKQMLRLLLPFVVTIGMIIITQVVLCLIYGKTVNVGHVMGPLWFLPALCWGKIFAEFINSENRRLLLIGFIVGLVAYVISLFWKENRLFIIQGLCAFPFVCIGKYLKKRTIDMWMIIICIIAWIFAILLSSMDVHQCVYKYWLLDILGACGGTYILYKLVDKVCAIYYLKSKNILLPISWLGKYSLAALCMHGLEWKALLPLEEMYFDGTLLLIVRFIVTLLLILLVTNIPIIKKIYN